MKQSTKPLNGMVVFAVLAIVTLGYAPSAAHAWQLGADTGDSVGYYGIYSTQKVVGYLPSSGIFLATSGFTDTSSVWHTIELIDYNSGSVEVQAEYADPNYHDTVLCTGLSTGTAYGAEIYWSSLAEWLYKSSATCNTLALVQSGTPTIDSGGSVDMMESSDGTASHYSSQAAYATFAPPLKYFDGVNTWIQPTHADFHVNSPPSSLGAAIFCSSNKVSAVYVESLYAPAGADGGGSTSC